jgi:hypothetical protein
MRRYVACFFLSSLMWVSLCGCGAVVRVQGALPLGVENVSGLVSGIQVTTIQNGTMIVTIVTFKETPGFTTTTFCGNLLSQFPVNSFAQVNFQPGQFCSTVVVIVIN